MDILNVETWTDFRDECSKEDLYQLICAYDEYIFQAFEDRDKIRSGWEPVSILEFANSEEFANMRYDYC